MCVVSMVIDHYTQPWNPRPVEPTVWPPGSIREIQITPTPELKEQWSQKDFIKNLEELLQKAKKYDEENGEPDCEMDEKRLALKKIADEMGIEIKFI